MHSDAVLPARLRWGLALLNHPTLNFYTVGRMRVSPRALVWGFLLFTIPLMFMSACGSRSGSNGALEETLRAERIRFGNIDLAQMDVETHDVNGDGEADVFRYYVDGSLRVERYDLNFDGRPDMTAYYDTSGVLVEEEFQLDYDDLVDVVRYYEDDTLVEKRVSIDFDGSYNLVKYYDTKEELLRVERDSDQDGVIDVWEYYSSGRLVRVGRDLDGDGHPEVVNEIR